MLEKTEREITTGKSTKTCKIVHKTQNEDTKTKQTKQHTIMIPEKLTSSRHDIDNKLFAKLLTTICHSKITPHQSSQRQI